MPRALKKAVKITKSSKTVKATTARRVIKGAEHAANHFVDLGHDPEKSGARTRAAKAPG